jgi:hypothetical protein
MQGEHYRDFIKEAFISPIRSVLIVDDDYPTFDEVLDARQAGADAEAAPSDKKWLQNPGRIKSVISRFRDPRHPLLVDIHDGSNVPAGAEPKIAAHLHQSDLLVLDYELDKAKQGDGSMAFEIIRSLMRNNHFNLVVVHTSELLEPVFQNTLVAMLSPAGCALTDEDSARALALLEESEEKVEGSYERIRASIGVEQYLFARRHPDEHMRAIAKGMVPFAAIKAEADAVGLSSPDRRAVAAYLLAQVESAEAHRMNPDPADALVWGEGGIRYIKGDSVFVAFSNKGDEDDLMGVLLDALSEWCPRPSRLFLAKLRAEIDDFGAVAQGEALEKRFAHAHWYRRLLSSDGNQRRWYIAESVTRHSERLMNAIFPRVAAYAKRLVEADGGVGTPDELSKAHFNVDFDKPDQALRAEREHNALVSTTERSGWHLTTGHVFAMGDDHWVCLSPACDTVPGQLSPARIEAFGERLPFMAVRLHRIREAKKIKDVQSNRYLFLPLDGAVESFCFNEPSDHTSAPVWQTFYAEKKGELDDAFGFEVWVTEQQDATLVQRLKPATVVAQLRYEYALNLVHKLGGSMTRIGLDFA